MAALGAIRTGIKTTLVAALGAGIQGYDRVPAVAVVPAFVVSLAGPGSVDFEQAMGKGTDTYLFNLHILVPSGDGEVGQSLLDPYVSGVGAQSIRSAIFAARDLGLTKTHAHVSGLVDYDFAFEVVQIPHLAATLRLVVYTSGTE